MSRRATYVYNSQCWSPWLHALKTERQAYYVRRIGRMFLCRSVDALTLIDAIIQFSL